MEIKIQCGCGTKYKFEVEPINGRMPIRVQCPGCGADGTTDANQILAQKLPYVPPAAVQVISASPVVTAPASAGLRIAGSTSRGGAAAVAEPEPEMAQSADRYGQRSLFQRTTFFIKERVAILKLTDTYDILDPATG